ncbi:biotin-dependent carboxyltransferase family protein [Labrys wisconsinensis]|uniref:Biotin-dependent carboxylase-like uncharacterized protein n=1 Tax=Labrys wisconsinensis TaxID=425677 RepID=A0ABU0JJX3_9HYPH|nr:biotin-dependent carboxyltransferase family protein [Labrys wisconsinensis]MDQ0474580.1 biotin-dependent carboxylase-like uncharacterized protein [Labrys wisconsinensis]
MADHLAITDGGPFSTLQDSGRFGYQRFGISASGAMDAVALAAVNALLGNPAGTAAIEMTMAGLAFTVEAGRCRIAVAGAPMPLTVNGEPAATGRAHDLAHGDRVKLGAARQGLRAYLGVAGGFALAPVLGSLSTHTRSGIGGLEGRALRAGDRLALRGGVPEGPPLQLDAAGIPDPAGPIRVLLGPQDDAFTAAGIATFLSAAYTVSTKADRMGCQLDGAAIEHRAGFNIVSDGIMNGSIQVPGHGRPIVLLADRQTTGGYPKIATVIGPDLFRLAQRRPGETVRFTSVSAAEAEGIAASHRDAVEAMVAAVRPVAAAGALSPEALLGLNLISGVVSATDPGERVG